MQGNLLSAKQRGVYNDHFFLKSYGAWPLIKVEGHFLQLD